jgi:hypothetical protein
MWWRRFLTNPLLTHPRQDCERNSSHRTNHTSALLDVVEHSGSLIRVYSTSTKHMQKVVQVTDLLSTLLIEMVWVIHSAHRNVLGLRPLPIQVSIKKICERHSSRKTNHTLSLVMWWKTVVQPSGFTSLQPNKLQKVVQVTDLPLCTSKWSNHVRLSPLPTM